ncbi:hypothetical protein INT43_008536 [Umbelopsis isabellina]|uniref:Uncharacterized protein n=1 Tax=Mortierella isabellina TaxID=91625 RepID=A0A8H7PVR0_MORIS|nr:hypothetical protein INT43_008536 [Umbelopsis isabellina]
MDSQPQPQAGRFRRLLGGGGKNKANRLSLNTSTTFLSESLNKSSDAVNRRQSMQILPFTSSTVSSATSRSTKDTDSEFDPMSPSSDPTSQAEAPSVKLEGVPPAPQRNQSSRSFSSFSLGKKKSQSSFVHSPITPSPLELTQSPTSFDIEFMMVIPEHDTVTSNDDHLNVSNQKDSFKSIHNHTNSMTAQRLEGNKRSLSTNNLRSDSASGQPESANSSSSDKSSGLGGARKRLTALLPESWQSNDSRRARRSTLSSLSHNSDNETSASDSPPMTPANPNNQFVRDSEQDDNEYHLPHHLPITPLSTGWSSLVEDGEYFAEKKAPATAYAPLSLPTANQNGNSPATTHNVATPPPAPMPFFTRAQSSRSLKSSGQWGYDKPATWYLADQVRNVLGSALTEADMEIEQEWENHQELERQNSMTSTYHSRAVGGLA